MLCYKEQWQNVWKESPSVMRYIDETFCPSNFLLEDKYRNCWRYQGDKTCKECWQFAVWGNEIPKPCPFCGQTPNVFDADGDCFVKCMNDDCSVEPASNGYRSKSEAIKAWNTRTGK